MGRAVVGLDCPVHVRLGPVGDAVSPEEGRGIVAARKEVKL